MPLRKTGAPAVFLPDRLTVWMTGADKAYLKMARAYHEVASELRRRIEAGEYGVKTPLPSERALEQEFDIHRATVRRALNVLVSEGLLTRSPGQRAFPKLPATTKTASIGLFACEPSDPFARSLIANGMSEVLLQRESTHHLVWSNSDAYEMSAPNEAPPTAPVDDLCALVLWPPLRADLPRLREVKRRMPVVLLDVHVPGFESDFIGFQDFEAGYQAAQHLYSLGHRRLTYIGSVVPETAQFRRWGFQKFCQDAGIEPVWRFAAGTIMLGDFPSELGQAIAEMPRSKWPTAGICTNDDTAALTMSFLARHGLRVPDDLGLVGFSNAQTDMLSALRLTTMEQPYVEAGREAARLVLDRLEGEREAGPPVEIRLPMKLVVRASCGA